MQRILLRVNGCSALNTDGDTHGIAVVIEFDECQHAIVVTAQASTFLL